MARKPRRKSRSGIYHVMLRGINKQTIFEDDQDKRQFLETVQRFKSISNYSIFAYCLMDNHVHLLLRESDESLSIVMKRISSSYVYWYNRKYERTGHLFQGRFKAEVVEDVAYFLTVLRYIHQNPLKAGLTEDVFSASWTSVNNYIEPTNPDMIDIDFGLRLFASDKKKAIHLYKTYMKEMNDDQCLEDIIPPRISDEDVRSFLSILGIENKSSLQQMDKEERDAIIAKLKRIEGVSLRQLARIIGISKSVIQRIE